MIACADGYSDNYAYRYNSGSTDTTCGTTDPYVPRLVDSTGGDYVEMSSNLSDLGPPLPDPEEIAKAIADARRRSDALAAIGAMEAARTHAKAPLMAESLPRPCLPRPTRRRTCTAVRNFRKQT